MYGAGLLLKYTTSGPHIQPIWPNCSFLKKRCLDPAVVEGKTLVAVEVKGGGVMPSCRKAIGAQRKPLTELPSQTLKMPGPQIAALLSALGRMVGVVRRWRIPEKG